MSPEIQELLVAYRAVRPALLPVLPAAVLTLFGLLALLVDVFELGRTRGPAEGEEGTPIMAPYLALIGTAIALGCVVWQTLRLDTAGGPYFSGMVVLDGFGVFLSGVVLAATFLTLLLTIGYCRRHDIHLAEYYHLILMAAAGMLVMVLAGNLINILDPQMVVIGGGVTERLGEKFVAPIRRTAYANLLNKQSARLIRIVPAGLKDASGVVGAAVLARQRLGR